ncbi:MAG: HD-GYP domain-containing protein [Lachnospiraceae bacterium]
MNLITIKDLHSGMVTAEAVRTKTGQIIVKKNITLTNQLIHHLDYYGIPSVAIVSEEKKPAISVMPVTSDIIPYHKSMRNNIESKHFEKKFIEKIEHLKMNMNDVIVRNEPTLQEDLLSDTVRLINDLSSAVDLFDMLHTIRKLDDSTYAHCINVAIICRMMGQWLHFSSSDTDALTLAGLLHDIGKCNVPSSIIHKPSALTSEEYNIVKQHSQNSYSILKDLPLDPRIRRAALMHHERGDGSGYPTGLVANDLDDFAVIVSIADVYDAMTSNRCYRNALCPFEVIATFEKEGFQKYKPQFVTTFLEHIVDTYMNNRVMLNDGSFCKIVLKNRINFSCPTVYSEDHQFIDLSQHPDLYIQAIV